VDILADCLKLELNPDCFQEEPVPSTTTTEGPGDTSTLTTEGSGDTSTTTTEGSGNTSTSTTEGSGDTSTTTTEGSGDTSTTTTDKPDDGGDSGALGLTVSKFLLLSSALLYGMVV
jgi:hypothetical protein